MIISYDRLWKLLIDKKMKKKDLQKLAGISSSSIAKLGRDEHVNTVILQKISATYTDEQKDLAEKIPNTEAEIGRLEALVTDVGRFIEKAKRYTCITELTPEILRTFISKIVVHEKSEKYSRNAEQKIEIHYAHIGAMEYVTDTANEEMVRTA